MIVSRCIDCFPQITQISTFLILIFDFQLLFKISGNSIKRHIRHPLLLPVIGHGKAQSMQPGIGIDKCGKRLGAEVFLGLGFYGYYLIIVLYNEIYFQLGIRLSFHALSFSTIFLYMANYC